MPSSSGQLPFNRGLLLAYFFPLVIWVATSIATVFLLKDGVQYMQEAELSERILRLAGEYRSSFIQLRDNGNFRLESPSSGVAARRAEILRHANDLYAELAFLTRGEEVQSERLERAGRNLQEWFYDIALRPTQSVAGAALVQAFEESMTKFIAAEQDMLAAARARVAARAELTQWVVWSGLALGVIAKIVSARWIAARIGRSMESINRAADQLASGNMTARVHAKGEAGALVERFNAMAELIEKRNEQQKVLAELGEMLHSCKSTEEGKNVFATFVDDLFPNKPGVLYFIESNQKGVAAVTAWQNGEMHTASHMTVDECWALRLGHAHQNESKGKIRCDHVPGTDEESRCIPLPAFGGVIGLLFLVEGREIEAEHEQHKRFADAVAEQIALAFANIRLREKLKDQSIRDPLTELYNRRYLDEILENELARADRHEQPLSVIAFDIDHFKRFNDAHGHDSGDAVLRCIGDTLRDFFRPEDGVFRSGGEEFIVLLPNTALDDAVLRTEELRKEVAGLKVVQGNITLPPIAISAGIAGYPVNGKDAGELLKAADRALYRAKESGRNRVESA